MGCTGADLACFSGLPVGWAQNYTLWSMDRSLQHIFKHLDTARSSLMNLSSSSQRASTSSSSSSTTDPQDLQTLTRCECHSPESSRVQRTSSLHTNFSATQSLAYIFRERLQHRSCSLPNPSKNYSGQARVHSLPPFLLPQAKKNTTGKNMFLDNCNSIQRPCETKAVVEENDSWVPKEIRNSLELHIRRKIAQRVARPPIFRAITLSISPYPLVCSPIREKTTKKRRGNKVLKVPNPPSTNLRERPRLPCWAPIQLSRSARGVLEGHMAWKVCTLRSQRVPTAVKQSWAMLNCIIKVQNEGHKPQSSAKGTNKKPPDVSCCLLPMALETDQKRPTTPKSIQADCQLQPRPPFVTQDAFCSGVDVILGEATFLPEDVKKRLELCIKKNVNCLLKKAMEQQKNEKLSTGLQLQLVGTVRLLPTVESVPLGPRPQVQVKDSKGLTPESHGQVTDSLELNSGPQIQDTDEVELTPVPQKQDIDSLELKGLSSKVQDLDSVATTPVPEKHDADFAVLTSGSPVQDVDSMGPTPGLQIKNIYSGGLSLGSQVKLTDSKELAQESQVKLTDPKGLISESQVKLTDSKDLAQGSQVKLTDSKGLILESQVKLTDSKDLAQGSQVKLTDSKGLIRGSQVKLTDSKDLAQGSQVKLTDSKGLIRGSQVKLTDSKELAPGSQVKLTYSKSLAQRSQVKLTDSKGLISGSQVRLTDSKGLAQGSQVKLTDSKELAQVSQVRLTDSKELAQGSQVKLTDSKGLAQGSQVKLTDSKELAQGSQVRLTDSKELAQGSQVRSIDSKGLISGSQIRLTDSKELAQGSQVRLTDSKELAQGSQVRSIDSKGLAQGSQVKLTDSKELAQGSQVRLTDSKELAQGSQVRSIDSKGLISGSQIRLTDSKVLAQGSQVRLTDSKELAQGPQVRSIDSKGLISGSQIRLTDSKGLVQGSQVKSTDSKELVQGSQVKSTDSKGLAQKSQIKFKDSKGLTLKPHVQVMDSAEVTPGPLIQVIDSLGVTSTSKFQFIDPKQLTLKLQSPIGDSFHLIQSSTPLHILSSSRTAARLKQGLHGSKTQEILRSVLGDLNENTVFQKPFILRMSSKFSKTEQPSTLPRPLSVQSSHSLRQRRLSPQCLFQAPLLPPWRSENSFCQERSRTPKALKQSISKRQVKAQEQRISKGRVARRKSSSNTSMLRKNLWAKMQQASLPVQKAHGQRLPPVSYPYAANEHFFPPRQMMVSQYCQAKIMGTPPRTSLSQRDTLCQLCRKYSPFSEELENSRPRTSQDYPNVTTKEAQGSSEPMERRKEREQVPSELSELPQSTSPQLPSSHKMPSTEKKPVSVEQNEKPDSRSQIRTSESQPRPLSVTSSHEQTQLLQDLQLKIAQKLLKKQLSPNFTPSLTTDMVLQYPICLQCGRCSGPGCPHKFHDSDGSWLLIYPRLRLFRNSEGRGEFRVHLGFRLRTRNQTQTPKQQREVGSLVSMSHASSQSDPPEKRKDKVCMDHVTKKNFTLSPYPKTDRRPKPFQTTEPSQSPKPIQVHVKRNLPGRRVEVVKSLSGESKQYDFTIQSFLDTANEGDRARGEAKRILYSEQVKTPKDIRTMTQKIERVPRQRIPPKDREIHPKRRTEEAQKVASLSRHSEKSTGFMEWLCLRIKRALGMAYSPRPSSQQMHDPRARQQGSVFPEQSHVQHGSKNEGKQWVKILYATSLDTKMERKKPEIDGKKTDVFRPLPKVPKSININQSKSFLKSTPKSRPSHRSISPVPKSSKIPHPRSSPVPQSNKISHSIPSHQYTSPDQRKCCSGSVNRSNKTKQTSQGHKVILGGPVSKQKIPQQDAQGDRTGRVSWKDIHSLRGRFESAL
ncbi:spermatogenesis-associated protein 31H1 isoform X2 [Notamacropus eugenii]